MPKALSRFPAMALSIGLVFLALLLACGGSDTPSTAPVPSASANPTPHSTAQTDLSTPLPPATPPIAQATPETERPTPTPVLANTSPEMDRETLVVLYNATGGAEWWNNQNWLSDAPMREWAGVDTDDNGRVRGVTLGERYLGGELPAELGNLANLTRLDLYQNHLSGELPAELATSSIWKCCASAKTS